LDRTRRSIVAVVWLGFALGFALVLPSAAVAAPLQVSREDSPNGCVSQMPVSDETGTILAWQSTCSLTGNNGDGSQEIFRAVLGSSTVQITSGSGCTSGRPTISANGKRIAFESTCNLLGTNADANSEIFLWNDGILLQLTASLGCENMAPSINGPGTFIAFDSTCNAEGTNNDGRGSEIFRLAVATGVLKQLTSDAVGDCDSTSASIDSSGALVAFDSDCDLTGENEDHAIQIFTVTGSGVVKQKTFAVDDSCSALRPAMDASGSIIAFHSDCDFTGSNSALRDEIFTVEASGVRQVTTAPNGNACASGEVRMAASGTAVAFTSYCRLNNQNVDGSLEVFHSGVGKAQGGILAVTDTTNCASFAGGLNAGGTRVSFDSDCNLVGTNGDLGVEIFRDTACACGAPATRKKPLSSDALFVLRAAVGSAGCNLCECDTNNDGAITAADALRDLRAAVGQSGVTLVCPAP
jgi:hypothetical protein